MKHFDIAVIGAGIVGGCAALSLARAGYRIALVEAHEPKPWLDEKPDLRVVALANDNQRYLWGVLQGLATAPAGSADQRKLGDYFAACMDEAGAEKAGLAPLQPALARIDALRSARGLPALIAELQLATASGGYFFSFGSNQDFGDSTQVIAFTDAGGLGLPDRDWADLKRWSDAILMGYDPERDAGVQRRLRESFLAMSAMFREALAARRIVTGRHCFGCTAGAGSSCGGATA